MDESRRDRINQRIQEARRLASFSIPVDLANETEWLLADLADKESTIAQLLAEAERARDSAHVEREKLNGLVVSQAKRIASLEIDVLREKAFGDKHFKSCESARADNVKLERRIAELESSIANASPQLPTEDNIREAWYSYDGTGIEASAGVAKMLHDRFAPLLAAKDAESSRLQLALETKTREWTAVTTNGNNLKEQLRRPTSDLGAAESRAEKAERAAAIDDAPRSQSLLGRFYSEANRDANSRDEAPATIGDLRALISAIAH